MNTFRGLRIILDDKMVEDDHTRPTFPPSKNRSKRIEKKLIKRLGRWMKKPRTDAIVSQQAGFMVIHPAAMKELERMIAERDAHDEIKTRGGFGCP